MTTPTTDVKTHAAADADAWAGALAEDCDMFPVAGAAATAASSSSSSPPPQTARRSSEAVSVAIGRRLQQLMETSFDVMLECANEFTKGHFFSVATILAHKSIMEDGFQIPFELPCSSGTRMSLRVECQTIVALVKGIQINDRDLITLADLDTIFDYAWDHADMKKKIDVCIDRILAIQCPTRSNEVRDEALALFGTVLGACLAAVASLHGAVLSRPRGVFGK